MLFQQHELVMKKENKGIAQVGVKQALCSAS